MRKLILLLALLLPSIAFAQGGSVNGGAIIVLGPTGRPLAGATVTICASGATGIPCSPTITVYSDPGLTTPTTNPQTSDGNGNVFVYAAPGTYTYTVTGTGIKGKSYTATVAGSGGGNVLSGSPNTFTAANNFNGATNLNAGGILAGTFSGSRTDTGNNTHSGTETFTGAVTANAGQNIYAGYNFNNRILVDGCVPSVTSPKYANSSAGINSAIAAAIALGGGVVDATACLTLSTYNSEIDVGNSSGVPVTLLLPTGTSGGTPTWNASITDGVSYALKVFNNSVAIAPSNTGYGQFQIALQTGSNVGAVCGNDTTAAPNAHIRMEGFTCSIFGGTSTITKAVGVFNGMADSSYVGHMAFQNFSSSSTVSKIFWAYNNCCSTTFQQIVADAAGISGVAPCTFGNGNTSSGSNLNVGFDHLACVHPGTGKSNVYDQQWAQFTGSVFSDLYMENMAGADTTTAWISIQANSSPTGADTFIGASAGGDVAASTRYLFDIASGSKATIIGAQCGSVSANAVNDHNGGGTTTVCPGVNQSFAWYSTDSLANAKLSSPTLSLLSNGTGLQVFNTTTTCTTGASVGATCTTAAISLPVAEADTSYRVACTGKGLTNVPVVIATTNSSATQFTITIAALTAAAASFASYDCHVGHN